MSLIASAVNVQLKSILIATDFSQASEKPLCHALGIARCYGAKLYLANVVSSLGFALAGPGAIAAAEEAACRDAARLEDDLVRRGALSGLEHQVVVRRGEVWRELEAIIRQENIDLVVVGTHGRHGLRQFVLGSVAEQIFRHADCLVLTVGPRAYAQPRIQSPRGNRTFLLATDLGDASLDALQYAVSFANRFEARLVLLSVIPPVPASPHLHWCTASCLRQMQEEARTARLQRAWKPVPAKLAFKGLPEPLPDNVPPN